MKNKFLVLVFATAILASCSNDNEVINDTSIAGVDVETRSALDKIFTVEKVADDLGVGDGNYICTDLDGNFYYLSKFSDEGMQEVKKYDPNTKQVTILFNIPIGVADEYGNRDQVQSICIDTQLNLYYTTWYGKLAKVSLTDQSVTELNSRVPEDSQGMTLCGLSVADNGNVFFSGYYGSDDREKIFKITPQGNITKVAAYERGEYPYLKGSHLVKSKGAYVYAVGLTEGTPNSYLKISTTNGNIEYLSAHTSVQAISATHSKDNPYALRGRDIVRLRPTQDSDLLIGTIPSYITETGNLVAMKEPDAFCMNADATVFYVVINGDYPQKTCYKLTLE